VERKRLQLAVAETAAELVRPPAVSERPFVVSLVLERDHAKQPLQIALLDALGLCSEQPLRTRHPCCADR